MKSILIAGVISALVVASTATAALVVTSANIKNGTIKMVDISAGAKRALKGNRGPRGAQGPQGNPGPQGPQGIQRLVRVEASDSVAPEQVKSVVANCPAGMLAVSGGYSYTADGVRCRQLPGRDRLVGVDRHVWWRLRRLIYGHRSLLAQHLPGGNPSFDPVRLVAQRVAMRRAEH